MTVEQAVMIADVIHLINRFWTCVGSCLFFRYWIFPDV